MSQTLEEPVPSLIERFRERFGRRTLGIVLTILLEAMLALLVLGIGRPYFRPEREQVPIATFNTSAVPEAQPEKAAVDQQKADANRPSAAQPQPQEAQPQPELPPQRPRPPSTSPQVPLTRTPLIEISPNRMAEGDIANLPNRSAAPATRSRGPMGPTGGAARTGDTPQVGTAPNGQPMYAASWYREPTHQELQGYLSTADGPGWALIACRTVADYRVEDCDPIDEYPRGSHMLRAVLAAAWQFRVRPPLVGGEPQVGSWVRIRIDYVLQGR